MSRQTTIDFVAEDSSTGAWKLVLVEEGPWHGSIGDHLRALQQRLYGAIDVAIDGQLAGRYPESKGKELVVQVDGYNLPREEVQEFFDAFSGGVLAIDAYRKAMETQEFVRSISFKLNLEAIN